MMDKEDSDKILKLLDGEEWLSDWEWDFINSIAESEGELSPRRKVKLEEIYQTYLRRGAQD